MNDLRTNACHERYQRFGDPKNGPFRIVLSGKKAMRHLEINTGDLFPVEPALDADLGREQGYSILLLNKGYRRTKQESQGRGKQRG